MVTNCHQLKLPAADGKMYRTDCAQPETILRLVQSVPSPKAEPIKLWLAKVAGANVCCMNEREEFLKYFRSAFARLAEQLDTRTESEVLDGLLKVRAARSVYKEELTERIETMKARHLQRRQVFCACWTI